MLVSCLFVLIGLVLLIYGADMFVNGASSIARQLGMPPLIIGLTIVGFATSAPEILVGSVSALQDKTAIAIGNALGSNITNIGLVLGGKHIITTHYCRFTHHKKRVWIDVCLTHHRIAVDAGWPLKSH